MASIVYNRGKRETLKGAVAWESGSFKVLLVAATYTPNKDHNFVADVNAHEPNGAGYQSGFAGTGRRVLAGMVVTQDDVNDLAIATATDTTFPLFNAGTMAYAIIYKVGTSDADSVLIACIDVPDLTGNGTDVIVNWPLVAAGGIFYI